MHDNKTRVRLVKRRVEELEQQRARRICIGAYILAVFAAVTALGAAFCLPLARAKGE